MNSITLKITSEIAEKLYFWMQRWNKCHGPNMPMQMFLTGNENRTIRGEYRALCKMIEQNLSDNDLSVYLNYVAMIQV